MLMQRPAQLLREPLRQDLHVAGEHHELRAGLLDDLQEAPLGLRLGVAGDGHVVERDAVPFHERPVVLVVRDHRGDVHGEMTGLRPVEQVAQAVHPLRHHEDDRHATCEGPQAKRHPELIRDDVQVCAQGGFRIVPLASSRRGGHREGEAGEEGAVDGVLEGLRFRHVASVLAQDTAHPCDDAGTVIAVEGEDVGAGRRVLGESGRGKSWGHSSIPGLSLIRAWSPRQGPVRPSEGAGLD